VAVSVVRGRAGPSDFLHRVCFVVISRLSQGGHPFDRPKAGLYDMSKTRTGKKMAAPTKRPWRHDGKDQRKIYVEENPMEVVAEVPTTPRERRTRS
jgi:hypothetical protein